MLQKQFKLDLRSDKDFFSSCQKKHSPFFSLFYIKNDSSFKTTIVVPKKSALLATKRSKVRRTYYAALTNILDLIKKYKMNLVIVVSKKGTELKVIEVEEKIKSSLKKINV